jgi:hypothetical protein
MVETSTSGSQVATNPTNYSSDLPDGAGALFGLAPLPGPIVYFVDDEMNNLNVLK